jgi:hypothetical protein
MIVPPNNLTLVERFVTGVLFMKTKFVPFGVGCLFAFSTAASPAALTSFVIQPARVVWASDQGVENSANLLKRHSRQALLLEPVRPLVLKPGGAPTPKGPIPELTSRGKMAKLHRIASPPPNRTKSTFAFWRNQGHQIREAMNGLNSGDQVHHFEANLFNREQSEPI